MDGLKLIKRLEDKASILHDELSEAIGTENEDLITEINAARIDEINSLIIEVKSLMDS